MTARSDVLFTTDKTKLLKSALGPTADFTGMAASGFNAHASPQAVIDGMAEVVTGDREYFCRPRPSLHPRLCGGTVVTALRGSVKR
jgi:hypothetical protein